MNLKSLLKNSDEEIVLYNFSSQVMCMQKSVRLRGTTAGTYHRKTHLSKTAEVKPRF